MSKRDKNRISKKLSGCGGKLEVLLQDPEKWKQTIETVTNELTFLMKKSFFQVPSGTGLVALQQDLILVAITDIAAGTEITSIPFTAAENVIHTDRNVLHSSREGYCVALKKLIPFAGFGSFAAEESWLCEPNCYVEYRDHYLCPRKGFSSYFLYIHYK